MTEKKRSDRRNHNVGCCRCIKADGATVDLDHALLPASLAEQFEFATGQETKVGHPGAGPSVAVDGTDTKTAVATGLRKGGG